MREIVFLAAACALNFALGLMVGRMGHKTALTLMLRVRSSRGDFIETDPATVMAGDRMTFYDGPDMTYPPFAELVVEQPGK